MQPFSTTRLTSAFAMGASRLFLLTNSKSQSAIRLYGRNGFVHDAEILAVMENRSWATP